MIWRIMYKFYFICPLRAWGCKNSGAVKIVLICFQADFILDDQTWLWFVMLMCFDAISYHSCEKLFLIYYSPMGVPECKNSSDSFQFSRLGCNFYMFILCYSVFWFTGVCLLKCL